MSAKPILPVPMPHCPICDAPVVAMLRQAKPTTPDEVAAIQQVVLALHDRLMHPPEPSDASVLAYIGDEGHISVERRCRECGCTDLNACVDPMFGPCSWVEADLCSHCTTVPA